MCVFVCVRVCVCVCVCIYIYIYIYIYIPTYIHTYIHTHIYIYVCVYLFIHLFVYLFVYMFYFYMYMYIYSYACAYVYVCVCIYIYTYIQKKTNSEVQRCWVEHVICTIQQRRHGYILAVSTSNLVLDAITGRDIEKAQASECIDRIIRVFVGAPKETPYVAGDGRR